MCAAKTLSTSWWSICANGAAPRLSRTILRLFLYAERLNFMFIVLLASLLTAGDTTAIDQKISATLAAYGAPSVSVAIVQDGALAYAKAFGDANLAEHKHADAMTRYAVGSISKQFTVAAILLAQEQGKLSIDDKVGKYLPDLTRANEVSIRQLLSHTSGYQDFAPQDYMIEAWATPTTARSDYGSLG